MALTPKKVFDLDSWLSEPTTSAVKAKKAVVNKEIRFPIFDHCADCMRGRDPEWETKLRKAATGTFPANFSYQAPTLTWKKNAKVFNIQVAATGPEAVEEVVNFFRRRGRLFSKLDLQASATKTVAVEDQQFLWTAINRATRDCMVARYIARMKEEMGLTRLETANLSLIIDRGRNSGIFNGDTIQIRSNYIFAINGLLFEPETRTFFISDEYTPKAIKAAKYDEEEEVEVIKSDIPSQWKKCLKQMCDNMSKVNRMPANNLIGPIVLVPNIDGHILVLDDDDENLVFDL